MKWMTLAAALGSKVQPSASTASRSEGFRIQVLSTVLLQELIQGVPGSPPRGTETGARGGSQAKLAQITAIVVVGRRGGLTLADLAVALAQLRQRWPVGGGEQADLRNQRRNLLPVFLAVLVEPRRRIER